MSVSKDMGEVHKPKTFYRNKKKGFWAETES
jgi:hypothetical protein